MYPNSDHNSAIELMKQTLNSSDILAHNQKFMRSQLETFLNIESLEKNQLLYSAVINYHHAINIVFERAPNIKKIIESSDNQSLIRSSPQPQPQNPGQALPNNQKAPSPSMAG